VIDRRLPALVLLLVAGGLYGGVAVPARRAAAQAEADLLRIQTAMMPLRRQVAEGEPQRAAEDAWREAGQPSDGSVTGLRRLLLQAVAGAPVSGVRLSISAATATLPARTRFAAVGSFADLVGLSERLIGPGTAVVPERMRWSRTGSDLAFELDGVVLGRAR
jgi:hypothetical protein